MSNEVILCIILGKLTVLLYLVLSFQLFTIHFCIVVSEYGFPVIGKNTIVKSWHVNRKIKKRGMVFNFTRHRDTGESKTTVLCLETMVPLGYDVS